MKYQLCAIHDTAIDAYLPPFTAVALGQATRMFTDEILRKDSEMSKHPHDYRLCVIGTWDNETGQVFHEIAGPRQILRGSDVLAIE